MNTSFRTAFGLMVLIALLGCDDNKKIAKLEARLDVAESNAIFASNAFMSTLDWESNTAVVIATNAGEIISLQSSVDSNHDSITAAYIGLGRHEDRLDRLEEMTNHIQRGYSTYTPARPQPNPAMKEGIPAAVYDSIVADEQREYPNNYIMQNDMIKAQVDAYKKLHP